MSGERAIYQLGGRAQVRRRLERRIDSILADGSAVDVLSEARISSYYGANVRVIREGNSVFVLPQREGQS